MQLQSQRRSAWERADCRAGWLDSAVGHMRSASAVLGVLPTDTTGGQRTPSRHERQAVRAGVANALAHVLMATEADPVVLREAVAIAAAWSGLDDKLHQALIDAVDYSMKVEPANLDDGQELVNLALTDEEARARARDFGFAATPDPELLKA